MVKLTYQKSQDHWGIKAVITEPHLDLVFSGSFLVDRVENERINRLLDQTVKVLLGILTAFGLLTFLASAYQGWQSHDLLFLLKPSPFNLTFWTGMFAAIYFWAKLKQQDLQEQGINLLQFEEQAKTLNHGKFVDVYQMFNHRAKKAWNNAVMIAKNRSKIRAPLGWRNKDEAPQVNSVDLILSLLQEPSIKLVFLRLGVNINDITNLLQDYALIAPREDPNTLGRIPFIAFAESLKLHNKTIDPLMILCALAVGLPQNHILQAIFFNIDLTVEKLEIIASWIFHLSLLKDELTLFRKLARLTPDNEINRGLTSVPTFYLDNYSRDLTWEAKHGYLPVALGRGGDLHEIFKLISAGSRDLVIKGQEGTGRTTLINELAYKMASDQVPKLLEDHRLVQLDISAILGKSKKAESIFIESLKEAVKAGNIVIVIEELPSLSNVQSTAGLSLLELLINFLQNHYLIVVGTSSIEQYTELLHPVANFDEVFTSYELSELGREGVLLACCIRASLLEGKNRCFFQYPAIEQAVELTDLYLKDVGQPQKAIGILVEASLKAKNSDNKIVTPSLVQKIISDKTHIPTQTFGDNEAEKLLHLEDTLAKFIVGQKQAVEAVAEGLRRARSGLVSSTRPLASFLFLGPTGVGKTEVARVLAATYFGDEKYLLRLDMSEYQGPGGLEKLLGSTGTKIDSPLIRHIKNYPFCLLLLDEFEKASPEIANLFLQVLEDGRLTSGRGETLDLTHCLVIATSNAGTKDIQEGIKAHKTLEQIKQYLFNLTLARMFPPELLNRFDGIILFSPLSQDEVMQIAILQLEQLKQRLLKKGIKCDFSENVVREIAKKAYDPLLGARPIRRYIQDHIEGFIAKLILAKKLSRGSDVTLDFQDGQLVLK